MKSRILIGSVFFLTLALSGPESVAGEEDVFDSDTFIDPRNIGTELQSGAPPTTHGKFAFSDVQAGYVANFEDRSLVTDDDVGFFSVAHYQSRSAWQFGGKFTAIGGDRRGVRSDISIGHYSLNVNDDGADSFVSRSQVGLSIDDFEDRSRELELSGDLFVQVAGLSKLLALSKGGIIYSYRFKDGPNTWRLQYKSSYDFPIKKWKGSNVNATIFFGYEDRDDRGRLTPLKYKITFAKRLGRKTQLDLVVAPIYQFQSYGYDSGLHFEAYLGVHRLFSHDLK